MSEKNMEGLHILVVDDEKDFAQMVETCLVSRGAKVTVCYSSETAMRVLTKYDFDTAVLDVMMPGQNGFDLCNVIKTNENYFHIPVILLTAVADHITSNRYFLEDGANNVADDYIPKEPGSLDILIKSVIRLVYG